MSLQSLYTSISYLIPSNQTLVAIEAKPTTVVFRCQDRRSGGLLWVESKKRDRFCWYAFCSCRTFSCCYDYNYDFPENLNMNI
jgi:hypothetical protein